MGASRHDIVEGDVAVGAAFDFAGLDLGLTYALLGVIVAEILASNPGHRLRHFQRRGEL